jgi:hypothetical protein
MIASHIHKTPLHKAHHVHAFTSNPLLSPAGKTADGRFCAAHPDIKVRRKDLFSTTEVGCWRCTLEGVWAAGEGDEDAAFERLHQVVAMTKGKDRRRKGECARGGGRGG